MKFDPKKPKVSLRKFSDKTDRLAIKTFIMNKNNQAGYLSLKQLYQTLGRQR